MGNTGDLVPAEEEAAPPNTPGPPDEMEDPSRVVTRSLPPEVLPEIPDELPELPPLRKISQTTSDAPRPVPPAVIAIPRVPPRRAPLPDPSAARFRTGAFVVLLITVIIGAGVIVAVDEMSAQRSESEIVVAPKPVPLTDLPPPPARRTPPAPPQAEPTDEAPQAATLVRVRVRIDTAPRGAELVLAESGAAFGYSPESIEIPLGVILKMEVRAKGYESQTVEIDGSTDHVRVELAPQKGVRPSPPPIRGLLPKPEIVAPPPLARSQPKVPARPAPRSAPPARVTPPKNVPAEVGIIFDSTPRGANVFVDDVLFCEGTPCMANVKTGMRKIRLELSGHASKSDLVRIDKSTSVKWALAK